MSAVPLAVLWALWIVLSELFLPVGERSWWDIAGVAGLLCVLGVTWLSVEWGLLKVGDGPRALAAWMRARALRYHIKIGVDLRETPPYPSRLPRPLIAMAMVIVGAAALGLLAGPSPPEATRETLVGISASFYLTLALLAWSWAAFSGVVSGFAFWFHVSDAALVRWPYGPGERVRLWVPILLLVVVALAATFLDPFIPAVTVLVLLGIGLLTLATRFTGQIRLLWRAEGAPGVYAIGSRWIIGWGTLLWCGAVFSTCVLLTRSSWGGGTGGPTVWIGSASAWLGVLGAATWVWIAPIRLLRLGPRDPARLRPPALRFRGEAPKQHDLERLTSRGFKVVGDDHSGGAVEVGLDRGTHRRHVEALVQPDGSTVWRIHPEDLLDPGVLAELRTVDRYTRRKELITGVAHLMRFAKARRFQEGTGFWFAPHLWYVHSMTRDTEEIDSVSVGPPYHRILSADARHHCYEVFRATSVDLVFIEDGVPLDAVEGVLLQLFDHYDLWGVEPVEEHHFRFPLGVRVAIHAFTQDSPFGLEGYPEPDYDEIGRARVLHVLLDRGGDDDREELDDAPTGEPLVLVEA